MMKCALFQTNQPDSLLPLRHKFRSLEEINIDQLKLRPIVDQTGTYIYNASKVIAKYLKPLAKNQYAIIEILTFPDLVKNESKSNDSQVYQ